jgi:hypothetical protein
VRVWRDPNHPGQIEVYDDRDRLAARGHEEIFSLPAVGSPVRAVPFMFVADWLRTDPHPTDRASEDEPDNEVQDWVKARLG